MINRFLAIALVFISFTMSSCKDDDNQGPTTSPVESIFIVDLSNEGNSSDIGVVFESPDPSVDRFRVFVITSASSSNFTQTEAEALSPSSFESIDNTESQYNIQLDDDLLDTDGNAIVEDVAYRVAILSETSNESILSGLSNELVLVPLKQGVSTISVDFGQSDGLDGIALDAEGNLYISNFGNIQNGEGSGSVVYQINRFSQKSVYARGLNVPSGCVVGPNGSLYVTNSNNIHEVLPDGTKTIFATSSVGFADLVFDEVGNIYSGGFSHSIMQKINPNGNVTNLVDDDRLNGTVGLAYHQETATLMLETSPLEQFMLSI